MFYYLAVDGGGTKTDVICADQSGQVVGQSQVGPTNLTTTSVGAASFNLREGIRQATEKLPEGWRVKKMVMGLAGLDTPHEAENARNVFSNVLGYFPIDQFELINEVVITLEAGTSSNNAVAIISGTGSICYGRNMAGNTAKSGGMDYLLTDQGSGFEIGRYVLRTAVKSFDGRAPKSILEELVCQHFRITSIAELKDKVYNPPLNKHEVAALTKVCLTALAQNDPVAKEVLDHSIEELFLMAQAVINRLDLKNSQVDCVMAGSVLEIPYVNQAMRGRLKILSPMINFVELQNEPVFGALKMAMR